MTGFTGNIFCRAPGYKWANVLHGDDCYACAMMDMSYREKLHCETIDEARAEMNRRCGPGNWHECGWGCCPQPG